MKPTLLDNGGRRLGLDRRQFSYNLLKCHDCYKVNPIIHDSYKLQRRHFHFCKIADSCL